MIKKEDRQIENNAILLHRKIEYLRKSILKYFYRLNATLIRIQIECLETLLFNSKVNMAEHSKEFIKKILEKRRELSSTEVKIGKVALQQSEGQCGFVIRII